MITTKNHEELYTFSELDESAKNRVARRFFYDDFEDYINCELEYRNALHFRNSPDVKWQWAFNSCQGDGVNIYGRIDFSDLCKLAHLNVPNGMTGYKMQFDCNHHYSYCLWDTRQLDIVCYLDAITEDTSQAEWKDFYAEKICEAMTQLCESVNNYGNGLVLKAYDSSDLYSGNLYDENGDFICHEWDDEAQPLVFDGTIDGLNDDQYDELCGKALCDIYEALGYGTPSYGELASAGLYITRHLLDAMYGDVIFSEDDFSN